MKEYLNPLKDGGYELSNDALCEDSIEVPSGAEIAIRFNCDMENHGIIFYKNDGKASASEKNNFKWDHDSHWSNVELLNEGFYDGDIDLSHKVLWVRPTHPEPLPFIDDNPQSLNDQYAEIEQVRQDVINNPNHYTSGGIECLDAMQAMLSRDEFIGFLRGNIFKYNWRYQLKNGVEDLKKAQFYQNKLIELEFID